MHIYQCSDLETIAAEAESAIVGITESWASNKLLHGELQLNGYTCYRKYRPAETASRGGGVLLYVKDSLDHREFTQFDGENN
ncbi:hypothetical protein EB796_014473 [Bugula neritina]|uniref:Uncharacterized protein n=1 Tax=Bugula neritina TaxID=10212 RepID=A0A7J7JMD2_BUGNE|nr:hypothetical protein EB796_014473 [Bugula neritina]